MTAPDETRRLVIRAAGVAALAGLAGCSSATGADGGGSPTATAAPSDEETRTATAAPSDEETRTATAAPSDGGTQTATATPEADANGARDVTFPSSGGATVRGTLYGSGTCGVVLVPQINLDRESWAPQATALADAGYAPLAIDEGDRPAEAVRGAAAFLRDERGVEAVVLVGASSGGEAVLEAAAGASSDVDGVVTLSAGGGADAAGDVDARLLVVVSRNDRDRFVDVAHEIFYEAAEPKRLEVLGGGAHGQRLFTSEQGDLVSALVQDHLEAVCG